LSLTHKNDEIRQQYAQMRDLYDKKLWHQLTVILENVVNLAYFDQGVELVQLYLNFVRDFEKKMNQLTLVKLVLRILREITDVGEAASFLQKVDEKLSAQDKEAHSLCMTEIAWYKLKLSLLDESKQLLDQSQTILDTITGADPGVYSSFYRTLAMYYKIKVVPTDFYKNALMYLVYTSLDNLPLVDQQTLAFDMGIAALVSTDIHNFGELLASPVLKSLENTKAEWLKNFLFAFNSGNIGQFENYITQYKSDIENQPALKSNFPLLREKISILALMELVFTRPSEGRTLSFKVIADATKLPVDEVELLVMKSLSLKLIKGQIDEVNQTVSVWWVQPRVLDLAQVGKLNERLSTWISDVNQLQTFMQNETAPELLT